MKKFLIWLIFSYITYLAIKSLNLSIDVFKLYIKDNSNGSNK